MRRHASSQAKPGSLAETQQCCCCTVPQHGALLQVEAEDNVNQHAHGTAVLHAHGEAISGTSSVNGIAVG